jgi:hypothetical protein
MARELDALGAHPGFEISDKPDAMVLAHCQPLGRRFAGDCPLDLEDRIDPLHRGQRHGGNEDRLAALCLALRVAGDVGQFEKLPP